MKLSVFAYYNKLIKAFDTKMQFDDHEDDKVVFNVMRGLNARLALGTYNDLRYLQFYKLGTFDDESGIFEADKTMLLDFDDAIASFECKASMKGDKQDVGNERSAN